MTLAVAVTAIQGQTSADLFNSSVLHRIDLSLHSSDWSKLKQNFQTNEYYPADLTWNGQTVRNVGIRSRGTGSRSGIKPGLRVDFDRYATDQTYAGLKGLVLRNQTQDASGIHEGAAMWFYNLMGIAAPRASYARLYVNGEYTGVYAVVEEVDKKMLARLFGIVEANSQNDGYLYEYNWIDDWRFGYLGSGLDPYKARFKPKTHEGKPDEDLYRPIETLVGLTNETPSSGLIAAIGDRLDLTAFMRYLAVQNFLAEYDGFVGFYGINNYYLYRLENQGKHVVIVWDASETFNTPTFDVRSRLDSNVLAKKLMEIPQFQSTYFSALNEAADVAAEIPAGSMVGSLETEIRRQLDLIDSAVREDTLKPFTNADFDRASNAMKQFSSGRVSYVKCEIERLTVNSSRTCP